MPIRLKKSEQWAYAVDEKSETLGKFIQAPSSFVFRVIFSKR